MKRPLQKLEHLEHSREPAIRRKLDLLKQQVESLEYERMVLSKTVELLAKKRENVLLAHHQSASTTGLEARIVAAHAVKLRRQILSLTDDELKKCQEVADTKAKAQQWQETLNACLKRQEKLNHASARLDRNTARAKSRRSESQLEQLSAVNWARGR